MGQSQVLVQVTFTAEEAALLAAGFGVFSIDELTRRRMTDRVPPHLREYSMELADAYFHVLGTLSAKMRDLTETVAIILDPDTVELDFTSMSTRPLS